MNTYTDTCTNIAAPLEAEAATFSTRTTNWSVATSSAEFHDLITQKRRILPWILVPPLAFFFIVTLLAGFARPLLSEKLFGGMALGYLLVIATYLACWISALIYVRVAEVIFDPLAKKIAEKIEKGAQS